MTVPTDIEARRVIKYLDRGGLLAEKLSADRKKCEISGKDLQVISKHHLNLETVYHGLKFLLENAGYGNFGHNGFSKSSKSVVLEGEAYRMARERYNLLKD